MRVTRWLHLAALLAAVGSCKSSVDPNSGRFSCQTDGDCGAGYECRSQAEGGGRCYRTGECVADETCNGRDDDCNGLTDELFPEMGAGCDTAVAGVCAAGEQACGDGGLFCAQTRLPSAELCDGLDNDCDGQTDEEFDFSSDDAHCGSCAVACAAGTSCQLALCRESECANTLDDDGDLLTDCDDPDCTSLSCSTLDPGLNCGRAFPGDGGPDGGELDGGPDDGGGDAGSDAGDLDGGAPDSGALDAGPADAGDLDAGEADGGEADGGEADGGAPDAGPAPACVPREADCGDGADDDLDGLTDCADADCDAMECRVGATCANSQCPPPG